MQQLAAKRIVLLIDNSVVEVNDTVNKEECIFLDDTMIEEGPITCEKLYTLMPPIELRPINRRAFFTIDEAYKWRVLGREAH